MEIESVDMSQVAIAEEQAAAQARADRERQQVAEAASNPPPVTDPNLGQTVNILD
jgi:hypothetical protein